MVICLPHFMFIAQMDDNWQYLLAASLIAACWLPVRR